MSNFLSSDETLEQLVEQAKHGNRNAMAGLYWFIRDKIMPCIRHNVRSLDPEDLLQDIILRVIKKISGLKDNHRFSAFVFRIARSLIMDNLRRLKRHKTLSLDSLPELPAYRAATTPAEQAEMMPIIRMVLKPRELDLFIRLFVRGDDIKTIQKQLQLPAVTVRIHKHRLCRKLAPVLIHFHSDPHPSH